MRSSSATRNNSAKCVPFGTKIVAVSVLLFVVSLFFANVEPGYLKSGGADDDALEAAERAISKEIITLNRQKHVCRCCKVEEWSALFQLI